MKTIVIMQPGYLPWIGFFELLHRADVFVNYDIVKFDKNGWRNRNRIKTSSGPLWLTVPVYSAGEPKLNEIQIDNSHSNWQKKHLKSIEMNYNNTPFFKEFFPGISSILNKKWEYLNDLNLEIINFLAKAFGINKQIISAAQLPMRAELEREEDRIERLIKICQHFGADTFYEASGGKGYLENKEKKFRDLGIELVFQNMHPEPYRQVFGGFVPGLSAIDLLFNCGSQDSLKNIIESGE